MVNHGHRPAGIRAVMQVLVILMKVAARDLVRGVEQPDKTPQQQRLIDQVTFDALADLGDLVQQVCAGLLSGTAAGLHPQRGRERQSGQQHPQGGQWRRGLMV